MPKNNNYERDFVQDVTQGIPFKIIEQYFKQISDERFARANTIYDRIKTNPLAFNRKAFLSVRKLAKSYKGIGKGLGRAGNIFGAADIAMGVANEGWVQGLISNGSGFVFGSAITTAGLTFAKSLTGGPLIAAIAGAVAIGGLTSYVVDKGLDKGFEKVLPKVKSFRKHGVLSLQNRWGDLKDKFKNQWEKLYNSTNNFKSLNIEKQLSMKNPTVEGVSGGVENTLTEMIVTNPLPHKKNSILMQLGSMLSFAGNLIGSVITGGRMLNTKSVSASIVNGSLMNPIMRHSGGKVSGKDEVLAILRGGETVRTEEQEQELQQEKYKELMENVLPLLNEKEGKPKTIEEAYDPDNKIPCLLNKTTEDEEMIISIISQAWKSNRCGFRNVLRYE